MFIRNCLSICLILSALSAFSVTLQADGQEQVVPATGPDRGAARPNVPIDELERVFVGEPPEGLKMYLAITRGSRMGPGEGWFGAAQSRYSWEWLAACHGSSGKEGITQQQFLGPPVWFERLDRNRDGRITADDLEWSDRNPWVQQSYQMNRLFRRMDAQGDGHLTGDEWQQFFDKLAKGRESLRFEELRDALLSGDPSSFSPGDAPSKEILLRGLFAGEIGSLHEGPQLDEPAPDFSLKTFDGAKTVQLTELLGTKPIVLVFGNFTCGPFRSMYPGVEDVYQRFGEAAHFLMVYVREAHPTDGWHMKSNASVGVSVAQPKTYLERVAVAQQCSTLLKPSMPLLVDDIDDSTGHAYSGMPARLYVIDANGKVAYKGGRGPFGFKAGEMEQALVMLLIDSQSKENGQAAAAGPAGESNPARAVENQ